MVNLYPGKRVKVDRLIECNSNQYPGKVDRMEFHCRAGPLNILSGYAVNDSGNMLSSGGKLDLYPKTVILPCTENSCWTNSLIGYAVALPCNGTSVEL